MQKAQQFRGVGGHHPDKVARSGRLPLAPGVTGCPDPRTPGARAACIVLCGVCVGSGQVRDGTVRGGTAVSGRSSAGSRRTDRSSAASSSTNRRR